MADIRFYHTLQRRPDEILPDLLEKALARAPRIVVRVANAEAAQQIDDTLWSTTPESFLPHGLAGGTHDAQQPVLITAEDTTQADILFLLPDASTIIPEHVVLCCVLFDGRDDAQVTKARNDWKIFKEAGHNLTYWQQTESGKWEQKA